MATAANLRDDATTALEAAGYTVQIASARTSQRVTRGSKVARISIPAGEIVPYGSNQTVTIQTVDLELIYRGTSTRLSTMETNQETAELLISPVADPEWWSALASVRGTPIPEVNVESELELVGEVFTATIRAQVALEA